MTEDKARELILTAIGQASMCWEGAFEADRIFLSEEAIRVGEQLLTDLELRELPEASN